MLLWGDFMGCIFSKFKMLHGAQNKGTKGRKLKPVEPAKSSSGHNLYEVLVAFPINFNGACRGQHADGLLQWFSVSFIADFKAAGS